MDQEDSVSGKSITPPRPDLPEVYIPRDSLPMLQDVAPCLLLVSKRGSVEEPLPPRPPPPFTYTSTLPPPAPKKHRSKSNDFRSKTLPVRKSSKAKEVITQNNVSREESKALSTPSSSGDSGYKCPGDLDNRGNDLTNTTNNKSDDAEADQTNVPCSTSETIFFTSFRKASQSPSTTINSLSAIGEPTETLTHQSSNDPRAHVAVVSMNGVRSDKTQEKLQHDEDNRKRKKEEARNETKTSGFEERKSCSPPSKRSSFENVKNIVKMSSDETKATKFTVTNCCSKQGEDLMNSSTLTQQQMKYSKHPVAPESLASRAKHESQEHIRKLKNVVVDEGKTKSSVTCNKQSHHFKVSSAASQRASSSSCSSISSRQSDKLLNQDKGKGRTMSPVLAIKNIMKKTEKDVSKKKKTENTQELSAARKEAPIVLEDKYSKILIRGGRTRSPTPSLASTSTVTSSLAPSNLSLLSEMLSETEYQAWVNTAETSSQPGKNSFKEVSDLDQYVADMIGFTQDIRSPRVSKMKCSVKKSSKEFEELVKILNYKKRQSTNLEMKKSLQTIIDFIGDKKQENYPPDSMSMKEAEELKTEKIIFEEAGDYFMDCVSEETVARSSREPSLLSATAAPTVIIESTQDVRPTPSPRLKRKNRLDVSSPTPSTASSSRVRSDTRVSITSFNSMIQDLCHHTAVVEDSVTDHADNDVLIASMKEKMEALIREKERSEKINHEYLNTNQILAEKNYKLEKVSELCFIKDQEYKKRIEDLTNQLKIQTSEIEQYRQNSELLKQKNEELEEKYSEQQDIVEEVDDQKKLLSEKQQAINSLNGLVIKLNEDIDNLKSQLNKNTQETGELNSLRLTFDQLKSEKKMLENENKQLAQENTKFKEQIERRESEFNQQSQRLSLYEKDKLENEQKLQLKMEQLKKELVEVKTASQSSGDILREENELLQNEVHNSRLELESYADKIKQYDAKMKEVMTEKENIETILSKEVNALKNEIELERNNSKISDQCRKESEDKIIKDKNEIISKLKSDLKKRGILLKDSQDLVEKLQKETSKKTVIKQMKDQIEDLESSNLSLVRSKKNLENDAEELKHQIDDLNKTIARLEEKFKTVVKENSDVTNQLEDAEEELQEMLKKYKSSVTELSQQQVQIQEQSFTIIEFEHENERLKEKNSDLTYKISQLENDTIDLSQHKNAKMKLSELEQKLDLEMTKSFRVEHQNDRLKDTISNLEKEADLVKFKHQAEQDKHKKLLNQFRDLKEDYLSLQGKESDTSEKYSALLKKIEISESENIVLKKDLELALKRIDDFHTAITSDIDSDSETITYSGDDDVFSSNYTLSSESIAQELLQAKNK